LLVDNGEVIPGLNEDWKLGGAKLFEWVAGLMMLIIAQELVFDEKISRSMPALMLIWVGTTFGLAALRQGFPDEERGLRNKAMTAVGIAPPGIPTPAILQPIWSAARQRELNPKSRLVELGIDEALKYGEAKRGEE
jgi:hypothetical protein